jgi:hypothetical protein
MAYEIGTASNLNDLLNKLVTFLTTNATLVGLGQEWTQISAAGEMGGRSVAPGAALDAATNEIMLQGPGLAGTDEILVSLGGYVDASNNHYSLFIRGNTVYQPSAIASAQPGCSKPVWMALVNTSMRYWFIANGRCFRVIVQAGVTYEQFYAGFILPEHLPAHWPYPLFIGGSSAIGAITNSNSGVNHYAYHYPYVNSPSSMDTSTSSAYLCLPGLTWRTVGNFGSSTVTDYVVQTTWSGSYFNTAQRQSLTGLPILTQGGLFTYSDIIGRAFYGRFDGVYRVPSFGLTPEQIATIGGTDYIMFPNVIYGSDGHYCAHALN